MTWLDEAAYFGSGAVLTNAIPHLVRGLTGQAFQSPFASPPGAGLSSATVNVLWGFANLAIAYFLIFQVGSFSIRSIDALALAAGAVAIGLFSARHFGQFHGGNDVGSS